MTPIIHNLFILFLLLCGSGYYLSIFSILFMTWGECFDCGAYNQWIMASVTSGITCIQIIVGTYLICELYENWISRYNREVYVNNGYMLVILNVMLVSLNLYTILSIPNHCHFELDNLFNILLYMNIAMEVILVLFVLIYMMKIHHYNQSETLL